MNKKTRLVWTTTLSILVLAALPGHTEMWGPGGGSCPNTTPALLDTDGTPGPSPGDAQVYLSTAAPIEGGALISGMMVTPWNACSSNPTAGELSMDDSGGVFGPGQVDSIDVVGKNRGFYSTFGPGQRRGSTWLAGVWEDFDKPAATEVVGLTEPSGAVSRIEITHIPQKRQAPANGRTFINATFDLTGWDEDGDESPEWISFPFADVAPVNFCEDAENQTLWIPVDPVPAAEGVAGSFAVRVDSDCDDAADPFLPPFAEVEPVITVPVTLQSFSINQAGFLPANRWGLVLLALAMALFVGRAARRHLPDLRS